jgi:MFS family permease
MGMPIDQQLVPHPEFKTFAQHRGRSTISSAIALTCGLESSTNSSITRGSTCDTSGRHGTSLDRSQANVCGGDILASSSTSSSMQGTSRRESGSTPRAALILATGFLVLFVGGGARFAIGLTLKPMAEQLSWGRSEFGLAVALFQVVSAFSMFVAGALADRVSLKVLFGGGLAIAGIGISLMSLVSAPWHALALYGVVFALGNGTASIIPVGVMVTQAFPARAGLANAVASSGLSLGQLVMVAALAAVLVDLGCRWVFVWLGVAHLVLLVIAVAGVPSRADPQVRHAVLRSPGMTFGEAVGTGRFWLLLGIYAMCGFDDFFVSTHVVAFAQDRGIDAFLAGNLLALMGLSALLGVLASGAWSDRVGPLSPTAAAFAARVAAFALISLNQSAASVTVFALVFGATSHHRR